jgi:hypothetical protein
MAKPKTAMSWQGKKPPSKAQQTFIKAVRAMPVKKAK